MKPIVIIFLLMICSVCIVNAKLYKWVDENGVTHYSNTVPPNTEQVETKAELKNDSTDYHSNNDLNKVINSYKMDNLRQDQDKKKNYKYKSSTKNEEMADYYEHRIKEEEENVNQYREDLRIVERESYSDSRRHNERVRTYESRFNRAKMELERVKTKYRKAKYGQ